MTFPSILKKSLFAVGVSAVVTGVALAETSHSQVVIEAFLNACRTSPDPASLSYYLDQLDNGTQTADQVKASIATSCATSKTADLCQHVSGLNDLCKTATN